MRLLERADSVLGRALGRVAIGVIAVGVVALVVGLATGRAQASLGVLAAAWLYVTGIAAGGVAVSAAIRLSHGRWAPSVTPIAEATGSFLGPALVPLLLLVLGASLWIPGASEESRGVWAARFARDLIAALVLWAVAVAYVRRVRAGRDYAASRAAVVYLLLFVATLSLWAVDFVMDLARWAPSTVIPPFYFAGSFLGGLAFAALFASWHPAPDELPNTRHDLGKLLFAFVIFWGYLLWAAYLPVWYEDMPDETGQLLARWNGGWKVASLFAIATVLAFPFFFFVPEQNKRRRGRLAVGALSILVGLIADRMLLVLPSLASLGGGAMIPIGIAITLGMVAVFLLVVAAAIGARRESLGAPAPGPASEGR